MTCLCCVDVRVAGMAVDITLLFRASVKTVKTRNKAIGVGPESAKDELVRRNRPKNSFSNKAKEVVRSLWYLMLTSLASLQEGRVLKSDPIGCVKVQPEPD